MSIASPNAPDPGKTRINTYLFPVPDMSMSAQLLVARVMKRRARKVGIKVLGYDFHENRYLRVIEFYFAVPESVFRQFIENF
jgi:hypothetical protein